MEMKKGTSIIELVVVIGLISLLALAMSAIMLTTIVSSNRIRRVTQVKQAGDYVINQVQTLIRNARYIESCDPANDVLTTLNPDGKTTEILLENGRIASNSGTYMTSDTLTASNFTLSCEPTDNPVLIKIEFDMTQKTVSGNARENSSLHFETTTNLRNE